MRVNLSLALSTIPIVLSGLVHRPVLDRFFRGDDFLHLYHFVNWGYFRSAFTPFGGHIIFSSNSIFYALHRVFGVDPLPFFHLAFATHLLSVFLLYLTIRCFTGSAGLAVLGATLWGMNPVSQGSLGWYSVYGHVLAAPCILWVLLDLARVSRRERVATRLAMARWAALLMIAGTSFGVGLGIAFVFPLVAYVLLPPDESRRRILTACFALVSILLVVWLHRAFTYYLATSPDYSAPSVFAALRPNPKDLIGYFTSLLSYSASSLLFGPLVTCAKNVVTSGPFQGTPVAEIMWFSKFVLIAITATVVTAFIRSDADSRRELLGLTLLALSAYALIALARSGWGSTPSTARYHYIGPACIAILTCRAISCFRLRAQAHLNWLPPILLATWLIATFGLYLESGLRIEAYAGDHALRRYRVAEARMAELASANTRNGIVYLPNEPFHIGKFKRPKKFPGWAAIHSISFPTNEWNGLPVRFVERDLAIVEYVKKNLPDSRIAELLIPPHQAPLDLRWAHTKPEKRHHRRRR